MAPLHYACANLAVAETLISEFGADICRTASAECHYRTPLDFACIMEHLEIVKMLAWHIFRSNKGKILIVDLFLGACLNGMVEVVRFLTDFCSTVDIYLPWETALVRACRSGQFTVIEMLLSKSKASILKALCVASANNSMSSEMFKLLLARWDGSVRHSHDSRGWTLLHHACNGKQLAMARMLLCEFEADVNCVDGRGKTPLHIACILRFTELAKMLLSEFVNCVDGRGKTPLHIACILRFTELAKMLLSEFVNCVDGRGKTPLHIACILRFTELAKMLLSEFKADVNCCQSVKLILTVQIIMDTHHCTLLVLQGLQSWLRCCCQSVNLILTVQIIMGVHHYIMLAVMGMRNWLRY